MSSGSAWRAVARAEWRSSIRDGRFRWFAVTGVACLVGAAWIAGLSARSERAARVLAQQHASAAWAEQTEKNPHAAAHDGLWAIRPATPLSALDPGLDRFTGTTVPMRAHAQSLAFDAPAMEDPPLLRLGTVSVALLLQLIVPLGIIVLGHAVVAGRREDGTWRLERSQGAAPSVLLTGKAAGLGGAILVVLLPSAVAAGVLAVAISGGGAPGQWTRGALAGVGYLTYFLVVVAITIAVSARARSARGALAVLVGWWALQGVAVPRLATAVARAAAPLPTYREWWRGVQSELDAGPDGHVSTSAWADSLQKVVLAEYGVTAVQDLPINFDAVLLLRSEEHSDAVMDRWMATLWRHLERQDAVVRWASVVSPMLAVRTISMRGAGTDLLHAKAFADGTEAARRPFIRALNEDMMVRSRTGDWAYRADRSLFARTAAFTWRPPAVPTLGAEVWSTGGVLFAWLLLGGLLAWRAVHRADEGAA